jgi:hypothetical protein
MTSNDIDRALHVWITQGSEELSELTIEPSSYRQCTSDDPSTTSVGPSTTSETCPPALFTTETLLCDRYTLNITVMHDQAVQIKEFDFIPCTSDGNQASASVSTTALTSASPSSVTTAAKQHTLSTGVIVGAILGAVLVLALGSLAFFILLRCSRRSRGSQPPLPSPPSPPSPFSRLWLRLSGRKPKPSTPTAQFLTAPISFPLPAAAPAAGAGGHACPTTLLDAIAAHPGSASASAAPMTTTTTTTTRGLAAPTLPWLFDRSSEYYPRDGHVVDGQLHATRDGECGGEMAAEKQPLHPNDADLDTAGLAFTHGYLPDSKDFVAWQEREQAIATGMSHTTEALPLYETRDSLRWSP